LGIVFCSSPPFPSLTPFPTLPIRIPCPSHSHFHSLPFPFSSTALPIPIRIPYPSHSHFLSHLPPPPHARFFFSLTVFDTRCIGRFRVFILNLVLYQLFPFRPSFVLAFSSLDFDRVCTRTVSNVHFRGSLVIFSDRAA